MSFLIHHTHDINRLQALRDRILNKFIISISKFSKWNCQRRLFGSFPRIKSVTMKEFVMKIYFFMFILGQVKLSKG